uniref:Uncharacterized protein n=1 Tax=Salarias fasciatus TaxID=181472 RepID=A0A672I8G9_SALFA
MVWSRLAAVLTVLTSCGRPDGSAVFRDRTGSRLDLDGPADGCVTDVLPGLSDIQEFYEATLLNSQKSCDQKLQETNSMASRWQQSLSAHNSTCSVDEVSA